jgi:putative DNA primase/helicase
LATAGLEVRRSPPQSPDLQLGKSFVALDLALCLATGRPFTGSYHVKQGPVVFVAAEGAGGMSKRVRAWMKHHGVTDWPENIIFICDSFNLQDESEVEEILKIAEEDLGEPASLFVLDTLNRLFGTGNENDQRDMTTFINNVDRLRRPSSATALIVHHTGKDITRGARGSSVLRPAADTMILLEETDRGNGCLVVCDKQKDFEEFETYKLSKKKVEVGDETLPV